MAFNLKKVLKCMLLSSNQPLALKDIQGAFTRFHEQPSAAPAEPAAPGVPGAAEAPAEVEEIPAVLTPQEAELYDEVPSLITSAQVREAMDAIAAEVAAADEGLLLIEGPNGYRLATHPRFARWLRVLRSEPAPVKLSPSSLETLAVIAYRQPVTRGEIEAIRGVSADAGLSKLLERELVYITGRADQPGRPLQYGTTDRFLEFTGIRSLDELPSSDVLSPRQVDAWLRDAINPQKPGDTDMGLADEELPLEGSMRAEQVSAPTGQVTSARPQESAPEPAANGTEPGKT